MDLRNTCTLQNCKKYTKHIKQQHESMGIAHWATILEQNQNTIGRIPIRRGIFQGDSLSPLLFVMALIPTTWCLRNHTGGYKIQGNKINHLIYMDDLKLYSTNSKQLTSLINTAQVTLSDIGLHLGPNKCSTICIQKGHWKAEDHTIALIDNTKISMLHRGETYKYLGISQSQKIDHKVVKKEICKEYLHRTKKIMQSKLNGENKIKAINTWAIPLLRYSAGIINYTKEDINMLDTKTRKILTINHAFHPKSDVDRLYIQRSKGGRGLKAVNDVIDNEISNMAEYYSKKTDWLSVLAATTYKKATTNPSREANREEAWRSKKLHGQYPKVVDKLDSAESWRWLKNTNIKAESEGLIMAAQDQCLNTNNYRRTILKETTDGKCRLCQEKDETINHITAECSIMAPKEYLARHNNVARYIHWELCGKYNLMRPKEWYKHVPEENKVIENENVKILWDFNIYTDRKISARRPDIVIQDKNKKITSIIDVAIPADVRSQQKEAEKITKYRDLAIEIGRIWKTKVQTIPIIVGALGAVTKTYRKHLKKIGLEEHSNMVQKTAVLGTVHILRRFLG